MPSTRTMYATDDGQLFDTLEEAETHEVLTSRKAQVDTYLAAHVESDKKKVEYERMLMHFLARHDPQEAILAEQIDSAL